MKIYFGLVGLFLALGLVYGEDPKEVKNLLDECEKEIGVSYPGGPPNFDDLKMKCLAACILRKEGSLADGKIDVEKVVKFIEKNHPGKVPESEITECANKANEETDICEIGGAFYKCLRNKHPQDF